MVIAARSINGGNTSTAITLTHTLGTALDSTYGHILIIRRTVAAGPTSVVTGSTNWTLIGGAATSTTSLWIYGIRGDAVINSVTATSAASAAQSAWLLSYGGVYEATFWEQFIGAGGSTSTSLASGTSTSSVAGTTALHGLAVGGTFGSVPAWTLSYVLGAGGAASTIAFAEKAVPAAATAVSTTASWTTSNTVRSVQVLLHTTQPPSNATATLTGIGSGEAIGTVAITATLLVAPTGIGTGGAFGAFAASGALAVSFTGIATGEVFGVPTSTLGGIPALTSTFTGVASSEAFGSVVVSGSLASTPTGIVSAGAFGALAVTGSLSAQPPGIGSAQQIGTLSVSGMLNVAPTGTGTGEAFGTVAVALTPPVINIVGIASLETFGTMTAQAPILVALGGIASRLVMGSPALFAFSIVAVTAEGPFPPSTGAELLSLISTRPNVYTQEV